MAESLIKKSYDPKIQDADVTFAGTTNYCSWGRLRQYLALAAGNKLSEEVIGVTVTKDGVQIHTKIR